jgi:adenine/guanine phosphoribosyltransferase-like PRPP-binding protein
MFQGLLKYIVSMQRPRYYEEKNWNVIVCIEQVFLPVSFHFSMILNIGLIRYVQPSWRVLVHVANSQNSSNHDLASQERIRS